MPINSDKPHLWKADVAASVDLYNKWFMQFAPKTYTDKRIEVTKGVKAGFRLTTNLKNITPELLRENPGILPMLRMATCPPLARDRLVGLANVDKNLVLCMEEDACPARMNVEALEKNLKRVSDILTNLLDRDILPWLAGNTAGRWPTHRSQNRHSCTQGCAPVIAASSR